MSTDLHSRLLVATERMWLPGEVARSARANAVLAALRAVVELHAPVKQGRVFGYFTCSGCDNGSYAIDSPDWPCSTIQTIAEHLGINNGEHHG